MHELIYSITLSLFVLSCEGERQHGNEDHPLVKNPLSFMSCNLDDYTACGLRKIMPSILNPKGIVRNNYT